MNHAPNIRPLLQPAVVTIIVDDWDGTAWKLYKATGHNGNYVFVADVTLKAYADSVDAFTTYKYKAVYENEDRRSAPQIRIRLPDDADLVSPVVAGSFDVEIANEVFPYILPFDL